MPTSLKTKTAQGLLWGGFSNGMVQLLGALFGLWLINILTPEDYGKMAALVIFSNIASVLQESGFTAALANKREPTHEEYNAVFWFNVMVGIALYILLFFAAPFIAYFYHEPVLCPLGRVAFLGFVFSCFGTAQRAYLFGHLMVKQTSIMQMASITLSGIVGVCLAYAGFAYWGLALQSLVYVGSITAFAWYFSPWRPTLHIDLRPAWRMFGFSSKLLVNSLAFQFNNNAFGVLLNRFFPGGHLAGIYSNARKWDDMAIATIGGMVQGVAQPVLRDSQHADACSGIVPAFRKLLRFTCFVSFPCLLGLALIAEDFIVLLAGEKWHESAILLSMLCVYGAFSPVVTLYSNLVISRGRSTVNMVIGLLNCLLVWGGIIALHALGYALTAMVIFYVALNIAWLFVWQACARHLIGLRWRHALKDVVPFFVFALAVMVAAWFATSTLPISWLRLFLRILIAVVLYVGSLWVAKASILRESLAYILPKHFTPRPHREGQGDGSALIILEGGLGNRMRVAAAAYAMHRRTGIPMRVLWTSQWGMRCRFDELFEEVPSEPSQRAAFIRDAQGYEKLLFARPTWKNLRVPRLLQRLCYRHIIYAPEIWYKNKEGFDYETWLRQGGTLMTSYRDFCPWTSEDLRHLFRPKAEVQRLIEARTAAFTAHTIGLHIRRTDHQQAIDESPLELFIEAIDQEIKNYEIILSPRGELERGPLLTIYLATDDEGTKAALRKRYGNRLITSDAEASRENTDGIRDALVEMFALSRTNHIYGSAGSTFSPIAACLGDVPITILQREGNGTVDLLCQTRELV